jgi:hypothetical protein
MPDDQYFALLVLTLISVGVLSLALVLGPVGRAIARRIEGKGLGDPKHIAMLEDLASREDDTTELRRELSELQERVDFAERLLAQRPDMVPLPGQKN